MSVLWRILSVAALVVSAVILVLSILSVRKESRVRPGLDLLRLGITAATTVLMAALLGVTTSQALMGLGLLAGLLLGVYEGLHLRVRFLGKSAFVRRSALGVAAWGVGVVVVQAAGVIGRIGLADFGLALSFLGIGQLVGLLTGRWQTVLSARRAAGGAAAAVLLLLTLAGAALPWLGPPASAGAAGATDVRAVMAGEMPGLAVSSTTLNRVCQGVAPSAREPLVRCLGTEKIASSAMEKMMGMAAKPMAIPTTRELRCS